MKKIYISALTLFIALYARADQLDGLENLATIAILTGIGAISLLVLIITAVIRFSKKEHKLSNPLNLAGGVLIFCSIGAWSTLGTTIDPGFRATCFGLILTSLALITLNYRIGKRTQ